MLISKGQYMLLFALSKGMSDFIIVVLLMKFRRTKSKEL